MNKHTLDRRLALQKCRRAAARRNGKCLSTKYINARTHMKWRCEQGHTWLAVWDKISSGQWCRVCSMKGVGDKLRHDIQRMQQYAAKWKGKCLSQKYIDNATDLLWQCHRGHKFKKNPNEVQQGIWCGKCSRFEKHVTVWDKHFSDVKEYVREKNGKILSAKPEDGFSITVQCHKNHVWRVGMTNLIRMKSWCGKCVGQGKTLEDLKRVATERQGKSLATAYISSRTKVLWECKFGHSFSANLDNVQYGAWCPTCGKMKKSIGATKLRAIKRGGKCLSEIYEGPNYHHKIAIFQCAKNHVWNMSVAEQRQGHWCPECLKIKLNSVSSKGR